MCLFRRMFILTRQHLQCSKNLLLLRAFLSLDICSTAHLQRSRKLQNTCHLLFHQLSDPGANIICCEDELCSCHIVFLIARLHHVQSQLNKIIVSDRCICAALQPGRRERCSTADGGRMPNASPALKNQLTAPCRLAVKLVLQPHSFM